MSENNLEIPVVETPVVSEKPVDSPDAKAEKTQLNALLSEARKTRDVLVGFRAAVETGTYSGGKMIDIAQGLAFLEAILKQNNAHIHNLQERIS